MKVKLRIWWSLFFLTVCLGWQGGRVAFSQEAPTAAHSASAPGGQQKKEDPEEINEFRHAPIVKSIAHAMGISTESAAQIFEALNSGILILVVLFFLAKAVPKAIRDRAASIQRKLVEARQATESANRRLSAVEAKLASIGQDIDRIRQQTERDMVEDEKRIKQSLEDERQRIVHSAEQEIESAGAAAKRELKRFAAELAVDSAARRIQLNYDADKALVERFGKDLSAEFSKGGRN